MANEQYLRPGEYKFTDADREKARTSRQANLLKKKNIRDALNVWLESEVGKDKKGKPLTGTDIMVQVAIKEAAKGNPKFWELIRDTSGQKPVEKVEVGKIDRDKGVKELQEIFNDDGRKDADKKDKN